MKLIKWFFLNKPLKLITLKPLILNIGRLGWRTMIVSKVCEMYFVSSLVQGV